MKESLHYYLGLIFSYEITSSSLLSTQMTLITYITSVFSSIQKSFEGLLKIRLLQLPIFNNKLGGDDCGDEEQI